MSEARGTYNEATGLVHPVPLRQHHAEAVHSVSTAIRSGVSRCTVVHSFGAKKTFLAWCIACELGAKTIVVGTPSVDEIGKMAVLWRAEAAACGIELRIMSVSGDKQFPVTTAGVGGKRLSELGVAMSRDPEDVALAISNGGDDGSMTVVFTTYASADRAAEGVRLAAARGCEVDLILFNKATRMASEDGSRWTSLMRDDAAPAGARVFLSSIERTYGEEVEGSISMDDKTQFGPIVHRLSFSQASELGLVCPYEARLLMFNEFEVDLKMTHNARSAVRESDLRRMSTTRSVATIIGVTKLISEEGLGYKPRHIVSFHNYVSDASLFSLEFEELAPVLGCFGYQPGHVWSKMSDRLKDEMLLQFKMSERAVLSNVGIMAGNSDFPEVDCVCFVDPRESAENIMDTIKNALQPSPGKKKAFIVFPGIVPYGSSKDDASRSEEWEVVRRTLGALMQIDDRIKPLLTRLSTTSDRCRSDEVADDSLLRIVGLAGDDVDPDILRKTVNLVSLGGKGVEYLSFSDARKYVRGLQFKSWIDFERWLGSSERNLSIPPRPWEYYRGKGVGQQRGLRRPWDFQQGGCRRSVSGCWRDDGGEILHVDTVRRVPEAYAAA